jgi:predicted transcriptional regulator
LNLFRTIALAKNDNGVALTSKTKELTRKQYYSRMSRMIKVGLVKRKNGKYSLTSLGKVVHESGRIIEEALKEYWKLRAIDSIQTFDRTVLPHEERKKIIDTLFNDNEKIKEVIL